MFPGQGSSFGFFFSPEKQAVRLLSSLNKQLLSHRKAILACIQSSPIVYISNLVALSIANKINSWFFSPFTETQFQEPFLSAPHCLERDRPTHTSAICFAPSLRLRLSTSLPQTRPEGPWYLCEQKWRTRAE